MPINRLYFPVVASITSDSKPTEYHMRKNHANCFLYAVFIAFLILGCGNDKSSQTAPSSQVLSFPVTTVEIRDVTTYKSYPATLEGEVSSEVRPKISGYIQEVLVKEGQRVKRGQTLFRIETQSLNQDAAAAKANMNAAQVEVDKLQPLVDKDIISEVQLETAKAKLAQARSSYNGIGANIDYANVKSPVDGVVGSINFRKGALASTQTQLPLTRVSSISKVYAYFALNEKNFIQFMKLAKGKDIDEKIKNLPKVKLLLATGDQYEKEGTIETIAGDIDPQTGTISFRARFDNIEGILRHGGSGTIMISQTYTEALVVPTLSTYEKQGKTFVFKIQADTLVASSIQITAKSDNLYVIDAGVQKGDSILANGVGKVRPGMQIKPVPTRMDSIINSFDTVFN